MLIETIVLLLLLLFGTAGSIVIITTNNQKEKQRALMLLIAVILAFSAYMVIKPSVIDKIVQTEFEHKHNTPTLFTAFGWTGGYNPYIGEWGGRGDFDDFDRDGIKNIYDPDADNDGVPDYKEYTWRLNPFEPDIGIAHLSALWFRDTTGNLKIRVKVEPTRLYPGMDIICSLYIDGDLIASKDMPGPIEFITDYPDDGKQHYILVKAKGDYEAKYASKVNNQLSYTLPSELFAQIQLGYWYSDLETQIQGAIKNANLNLSPGLQGFQERLKYILSSVPLYGWLTVILLTIIAITLIKFRTKKVYLTSRSRLKRLWDKLRGKKVEYKEGEIELKIRKY